MDLQAALAVSADSADPATLRAALPAIQGGLRQQQQQQQQQQTPLACARCDELVAAQQGAADACARSSGRGLPPLMFSVEQLTAMLRRENELRLSPGTQAAYAAAELREDADWMEVTDGLQRRVLAEPGVPPAQMERALRHIRAGPHWHPELKPLAIYHRHQRSRKVYIGDGDPVPTGIQLLELRLPQGATNGGAAGSASLGASRCRPVSLLQLASGPRPLALLAGSWS